jgi:hypothetical protein
MYVFPDKNLLIAPSKTSGFEKSLCIEKSLDSIQCGSENGLEVVVGDLEEDKRF